MITKIAIAPVEKEKQYFFLFRCVLKKKSLNVSKFPSVNYDKIGNTPYLFCSILTPVSYCTLLQRYFILKTIILILISVKSDVSMLLLLRYGNIESNLIKSCIELFNAIKHAFTKIAFSVL